MKRVLLAASAALLVGSISTPALAQLDDTDSAGAQIIILQPINVTNNDDLNLGTAVVTAAGSYELTAAGAVNVTGGATAFPSTTQVATFDVTGDPSATYDIAVDDDVALSDGNGNNLTLSTSEAGLIGGCVNAGCVGESDTVNLTVGGRIAFAAAPVAGTYTGSINVTATYN